MLSRENCNQNREQVRYEVHLGGDQGLPSTKTFWYHLLTSFLGDVGVVWQSERDTPSIVSVVLPRTDIATADRIRANHPNAAERSHTKLKETCDKIATFLEGTRVDFSMRCVEIDRCRGFQKRVLLETMRIPWGRVTSYGALAEAIHAPGAARAVGSALAQNPFPLIIPCHRVVKSDGHAGQFGGGREMKKALLSLEGVEIDDRGRIGPAFFR
ncbi:MAG: MGMT family protein [Syntrophobacterales bacterium]|nr:MAG: MGMT family protein [Syntrophobacterales bacterium]